MAVRCANGEAQRIVYECAPSGGTQTLIGEVVVDVWAALLYALIRIDDEWLLGWALINAHIVPNYLFLNHECSLVLELGG